MRPGSRWHWKWGNAALPLLPGLVVVIPLLAAAGVLYATTLHAGIATGLVIAAMAVAVFTTPDPNG